MAGRKEKAWCVLDSPFFLAKKNPKKRKIERERETREREGQQTEN